MTFLDTLTGGYGTLIAYGLAAALVVGAFGYTYHLGGKHTEATWTAKYSTLVANYAAAALAEGTRQANANADADAKAREAVVIATIESQSTALQELHRKLKDEASSDPTASDDCLNATARLRVNQVR